MELEEVVVSQRQWIFDVRRALHKIPEVAFCEEKTSGFVAGCLRELGLEVKTGVARWGVVGLLRGSRPGPTVMLRADMDALPIQEDTGLEFASLHPGVMHACGHDGNMAMALGAAKVLSSFTDSLEGNVKFVFQPAEEGASGAKPMIQEGVMDNPKVQWALGCHLWPSLPQGSVGVKAGPLMAAMDRFDIRILGRGGHGAMPHLCVDALEVGSQVVGALQRIVSRQMNPMCPAVVTVGTFHAGTAFNIIPEVAELSGTTRTFDSGVWESWPERIERVVDGVCRAMGAHYEFRYSKGCPPLVNDQEVAKLIGEVAAQVVGKHRVLEPEPTTTGEDMSWYLEEVPGCYFFLGVGQEGCAPLHNPRFQFQEDVMLTGVEILCRGALRLLGHRPKA